MAILLETAGAAAVTAAMLASTLAAMTATTRVGAAATRLTSELFLERQLEHLVDRAALGAGSGPGLPAPVGSADATRVVFHSDLDGDGHVAVTGAETTALELGTIGRGLRARYRLGKQTMTVLELDDTRGELLVRDRFGAESGAATATLVEMKIHTAASERTWLFAVPAGLAR